MLLKQHTVPSPISIIIKNIKNIKNNYTQYSQLLKKNKFYVVKTTYIEINNVYNLIVI